MKLNNPLDPLITCEKKNRALVIQGGGMRGIYSAGAMTALAELGLADSFSHIYASSSGAINGAYLIAGQTHLITSGYSQYLNRESPFIRYCRLTKIVDIDYLVEKVLMHSRFPLDVKTVIESSTTLHVLLTEFKTAKSVEIDSKAIKAKDHSGHLLYEVLRATSALPLFYGRVIKINGVGYVDGGITDAIPLMRAIQSGCTDITVITTRSPMFRRNKKTGFNRIMGLVALISHPVALRKALLNEDILFNKTMKRLHSYGDSDKRLKITVVYPSDNNRLASRTTRGERELKDCAKMGRQDLFRSFEQKY